METKSIMLQTLSVPCACRCRYCLLSWDGRTLGADYERSRRYALRFSDYMKKNRPGVSFHFTFGYCMDHPNLPKELDFLNEIGSVQGQFLQMNGFRLRNHSENRELIAQIRAHGVKNVNFTFYGLPEYHDRFAGRQGDFDHILDLAECAVGSGLDASAGLPLTRENVRQAKELIELLEDRGIKNSFAFIPQEEGRGALLAPVRLTAEDFEKLGSKEKEKLNRKTFKTEGEWVSGDWPEEKNRAILISLTPENIGEFENADFDSVIRRVEALDDRYYSALPSFKSLCEMYGNPDGDCFYGKRDLFRSYQRRYIAEHGLDLYDVTDERFCGSRRY